MFSMKDLPSVICYQYISIKLRFIVLKVLIFINYVSLC